MKTLSLFLAGALAVMAGAQTATYDTSILKNGNTWVYERDESEVAAGQVWGGFSGTVAFTLDSVRAAGDSILFRVIRSDSLRDKIATRDTSDSLVHRVRMTRDTARYAFKGGFSPSVPFFAQGQMFAAGDARVVYKGDTLRTRKSPPPSGGSCLSTQTENLETFGLTSYVDSRFAGCGIYSWTHRWTLMRFGNSPFPETPIVPVSLGAPFNSSWRAAGRPLRQDRGGIWIEGKAERFDLRGRGSALPAKP
jgi:hypothetical protein